METTQDYKEEESLYDLGYRQGVIWGTIPSTPFRTPPPNSWAATPEYRKGYEEGKQEWKKRKLRQLVLKDP